MNPSFRHAKGNWRKRGSLFLQFPLAWWSAKGGTSFFLLSAILLLPWVSLDLMMSLTINSLVKKASTVAVILKLMDLFH